MEKNFGNLILDLFKLNTGDEVIRLADFRMLSAEGVEYNFFFGNIHNFEITLAHYSKDYAKDQGEIHNFVLSVNQGSIRKSLIISHEFLNSVGEQGLIKTIKRVCSEIVSERLDSVLGGDSV
ncbi:hypothetical protein BRC2024_KCUCJSVR_CDS_0116 [Acinetobacter phage vB_AbaM_KissB]